MRGDRVDLNYLGQRASLRALTRLPESYRRNISRASRFSGRNAAASEPNLLHRARFVAHVSLPLSRPVTVISVASVNGLKSRYQAGVLRGLANPS
jgi:hypothetical protein